MEELWKSCDNKDGDGCDSPANVSYVWPGKDRKYACLVHANGIATIAQAIGLPLHFEQYEGEEPLRRLRAGDRE